MAISIIVGNGLSIDAANHCSLADSPSYPWAWELIKPYNENSDLLDVFPRLKQHLHELGNIASLGVYEAMHDIVSETNSRPIFKPHEKPNKNDYIHIEACHYLRIAYASFSENIPLSNLESWKWTEWLKSNAENIETVMSYNYDTIFEKSMRLARLGKVYGSSRQNKLFGPGLVPIPPEVYFDEKKDDIKVIHVAKPHGSCNFTGLSLDIILIPMAILNHFTLSKVLWC